MKRTTLLLLIFLVALTATAFTPQPTYHGLTLDDVLEWRHTYGFAVGQPIDSASERFGAPLIERRYKWLASPKTFGRHVSATTDSNNTVVWIIVLAAADDHFDVNQLLRRSELFDFSSGITTGSTDGYFRAAVKHGGVIIEFTCRPDRDPEFSNVTLTSEKMQKVIFP